MADKIETYDDITLFALSFISIFLWTKYVLIVLAIATTIACILLIAQIIKIINNQKQKF